jgi:hypothetical protein
MITRTGTTWSIDNIIRDLASRDIWAHGGGDAYADKLEALENRAEAERKQGLKDDLTNRASLAYQLYKRRTGQRVTSPGMGSGRHVPTSSPSGSTSTTGIVLTD